MEGRALVVGGTRGTGLEVARLLLRAGRRVRVLARDPQRARVVLPPAAEIVGGDIRRAESLPNALEGVRDVVFTAGVTRRPAGPRIMRETSWVGLRHVLAAAPGLPGRFVYMSTLGVERASLMGAVLAAVKWRALHWRRLAEEAVRRSGLSYTIVRAGVLTADPAGRRPVRIGQEGLPLKLRYRVARADVAEVMLRAMEHPAAAGTTFDVVWAPGNAAASVNAQLDRLRRDASVDG